MRLAICQQAVRLLLAVLIVADSAHTGSIRHPRELTEVVVGIAARSGGIATAICLREQHPIRRVAAGESGGNPCRVLLRERKTIHHHHFSGDGTGGYRTVLHSFRTSTILRPLSGSQAAFANKNRFTLDF